MDTGHTDQWLGITVADHDFKALCIEFWLLKLRDSSRYRRDSFARLCCCRSLNPRRRWWRLHVARPGGTFHCSRTTFNLFGLRIDFKILCFRFFFGFKIIADQKDHEEEQCDSNYQRDWTGKKKSDK